MPLVDPSESRYALVARLMDSSGNYLVPQVVDHTGAQTPFWAKPPLYFWLNALSYHALGFSELSSRLPSYVAMLFAVAVVFFAARRVYTPSVAWIATYLLCSLGLFSVYGGLCQIDMLLTASIAGALAAHWLWHEDRCHRSRWAVLFACALACGFLTKGPVTIALVIIAAAFPNVVRLIRIGLADRPRLRRLLTPARIRSVCFDRNRFPWVRTIFLMALLVAPWFILAEQQSPGLTKYFLFHENVLRFLKSDYGDRYGSSHQHTLGTIWLYVALSTLPWGALLLLAPGPVRQLFLPWKLRRRELFLLGWALAPALLFTLSKNLLASYALPGVPGFALLGAVLLTRFETLHEWLRLHYFRLKVIFLAISLVAIIILAAQIGSPGVDAHVVALLETNVALAALALIVGRDMTATDYRPMGESLMLAAGLTLFILQTSAGIVAAEQVPASTYAKYLQQRFPPEKVTLNFPFGIPYSAFLYLPHPLVANTENLRNPEGGDNQMVIVPDKRHTQFDEAVRKGPNHYRLAADIGDWKVYERMQ